MKRIQKYLYILAFTVVLLGIAIWGTPKSGSSLPRFLVRDPNTSRARSVSVFDAGNGNYYVFLPSYAELSQVTLSSTDGALFSVDEIPLSEGMDLGHFALETPYVFSLDQQEMGALWFFRSANVATMYLDTVSGDMTHLHQDKENKETASVTLYSTDGEILYSDARGSLTGRGNVTWEYDKRPYTLTLSGEASLLDMAPATKWVLLANAADETNLNNKLILDLAKEMDFPWTPDCQWVDLYLNGEYSGLYLLTEKVEVHENRLDLDTGAGDFLCRIDLNERWSGLNHPFVTGAGRTVEISAPEILGPGTRTVMEGLVREMEQQLLSGADLEDSALLDLDSWVRRYLVDEIFANIDADLASCYFYYSEGRIYAGPLWDYDMTLGNYPRNQDPWAFIAKNAKKSDTLSSPYYSALYGNASFHSRMVELYRTEFAPALQKLLDSEIDRLTELIRKASQSNSLRWRSMYDNLPADVVHTPSGLKDYLSSRVAFLNSAWLDSRPYCTIQFESSPGSAYKSVSVEKGRLLESAYINTETVLWVDSETGEVFDFSQPVTEDRILSKQTAESAAPDTSGAKSRSLSWKDLLILALMAASLGVIVILAAVDASQRKREQH